MKLAESEPEYNGRREDEHSLDALEVRQANAGDRPREAEAGAPSGKAEDTTREPNEAHVEPDEIQPREAEAGAEQLAQNEPREAEAGAPSGKAEDTTREPNEAHEHNHGRARRATLPDEFFATDSSTDSTAERTVIRVEAGELHGVVDAALAALAPTRRVYRRGSFVVEVAGFDPGSVPVPLPIQRDMPVICRCETGDITYLLSLFIAFEKWQGKGDDAAWKPCDPPARVAASALSRGGKAALLPRLTGILLCPAMRPDGTLLTRPGYDESTGYFLAAKVPLPDLPERPTREDARRAYDILAELFAPSRGAKKGFPWAGGKADVIVAIAAILSAVARPAITAPGGTIPAFCIDATTAGSGKGKVVDVVSIIGTGDVTPRDSWPVKHEEQDKCLGAIALSAPPLLLWDNVRGVIANTTLEAALTSDVAAHRILGRTERQALPWQTIVFFAGNNLEIDGDMPRRCILGRLEPDCEDPEAISPDEFAIPDLEGHTLANRARYLAAALTILRAYVLAGQPDQGVFVQSFTKWARLVGGALKWIGAGDISRYVATASAPESLTKGALRVVVREWARLDASGAGLSIGSALSTLYPADRLRAAKHGEQLPLDGWEELRGALEVLGSPKPDGKPDGDRIGKVYRDNRGRIIGGARLESVLRPDGKPYAPARWTVAKVGAGAAPDVTADPYAEAGLQPPPDGQGYAEAHYKGFAVVTLPDRLIVRFLDGEEGARAAMLPRDLLARGRSGCPFALCECRPTCDVGHCAESFADRGGCTC